MSQVRVVQLEVPAEVEMQGYGLELMEKMEQLILEAVVEQQQVIRPSVLLLV